MLRNNKGFTLIEVIAATVISFIGVFAAVAIFQTNISTLVSRELALSKANSSYNLSRMKEALKNSHTTRYGEVSQGASISPSSMSVRTSYFSNSVTNSDLYTVSCKDGELIEKLNGSKESQILPNVSSCKMFYYDLDNQETTDITKAHTAVIHLQYRQQNNSLVHDMQLYANFAQNT